jgi:hypothetical protein
VLSAVRVVRTVVPVVTVVITAARKTLMVISSLSSVVVSVSFLFYPKLDIVFANSFYLGRGRRDE